MRVKRLLSVFVMLGLLVASGGCKKNEPKHEGPKEAVTIGVATIIMSSPVIIAREKGYFAEEGLQVTFKPYKFGKKALAGLFAGENEVATTGGMPFMFNGFARNDYRMLGTITYTSSDIKVLVRNDGAIRTPADLKGKRIGIVNGTGSHFFAHVYLGEYNIEPSEVQLVSMPPAAQADALMQGQIDAAVLFVPTALYAIDKLQEQVIVLPPSNLFQNSFNLTAMKSWTEQHPETAIKILRAVSKATDFIRQNKSECMNLIQDYMNLSEDMLERVWADHTFDLYLNNSILTSLEDGARWAMKNRLVDVETIPAYIDLIYPDALKAVEPDNMLIVK